MIERSRIAPPAWTGDALILLTLSLVSLAISSLVEVSGKHPIEASAVAVVGGIVLRSLGLVPRGYRSSLRLGEILLSVGIVCLGASLNFSLFVSNGWSILVVIVATMVAGYGATWFLGRLLKLSIPLCYLLAVGTTICGGTAVAVIAPIIRAKEEETSYAIGIITLCGVSALLIYPALASVYGVSNEVFGLFAGVAIHSTPQVVGAAFLYSDVSGQTATAVKLIRNCFIAPAAFLFAFLERRRHAAAVGNSAKRAFPWFLFGFFIMAGVSATGAIPAGVQEGLSATARFLILVGMADVGLSTDLRALRRIGPKPLIVGVVGAVGVAVLAIGMIAILR